MEKLLKPGDCLYLPRGYLHAATALGGVSTHLTLGIHVWTRFALAQQLMHQALRALADDPVMRASLPLGVDVSDPSEMRRISTWSLLCWRTPSSMQILIRCPSRCCRMHGQTSVRRRSAHSSSFAMPMRITVDTQLVLRRHLAASVDHTGSHILVRSRAGDMAVAEDDVGPLKALLTNGVATLVIWAWIWPAPAARRPGYCGVSQPDPAFRCADAARLRADPLAGSAPPARRWLLLEHPGPWRIDAIAGAGIEPDVLSTLAEKAGSATRILLIRRPGRIDRRAARRWILAGLDWATVTGGWQDDQDLLEAADALIAASPPRLNHPSP